jgi:hypothetical protein
LARGQAEGRGFVWRNLPQLAGLPGRLHQILIKVFCAGVAMLEMRSVRFTLTMATLLTAAACKSTGNGSAVEASAAASSAAASSAAASSASASSAAASSAAAGDGEAHRRQLSH